jgi:hypothetical protein
MAKQIKKTEVPLTEEMSYDQKVELVVKEFESVLDALLQQFGQKWFSVYDIEKVLRVNHDLAKQTLEMCYYSGMFEKMDGKPKYRHILFNSNGLDSVLDSVHSMIRMHHERLFYCNVAEKLIHGIIKEAQQTKEEPKPTKTPKSNGKKDKKPTAKSRVQRDSVQQGEV